MARVLADDEHLAMASDDLALVAHFLDRRTYLHNHFLSVYAELIYSSRPAADECFPTLPWKAGAFPLPLQAPRLEPASKQKGVLPLSRRAGVLDARASNARVEGTYLKR